MPAADLPRLETRAVHAGEPRPRPGGAVTLPIYQATVYEQAEGTAYHDLRYIRLSNLPNQEGAAAKLAALEGTEAALVTASGMAALSAAFLTVLSEGDHILLQDCLYGGTHTLVTSTLPRLGLQHDFIDARRPETWAARLRPTTRALHVEALTNPLLQVADHRAVVAFAREHGLVSLIDSTFATPVNFRPAELGYDLVVHSGTKYLNGHSDLVAGAVAGSREWIDRIRHQLNHLGGCLDPHACFLLHRGMKTLALRVRRQNETALALARFLAGHPAVRAVNYPGLPQHPDHARAAELFDGFGGMISFELCGGAAAAQRLLAAVSIPTCAPSLGGVETLVTLPCRTSHAGLSPEERERAGIRDSLVRMSVGIEAAEDLRADLAAALEKAG